MRQGLVTRSTIADDTRSTSISLTERGRDALRAAEMAIERDFLSALSPLTDAQRRELGQVTGVLSRLLDPGDDESHPRVAAVWEAGHDG